MKCLACNKDKFQTKLKKTARGTKQIMCRNCKTIYSVAQKHNSPLIPVSVIRIS